MATQHFSPASAFAQAPSRYILLLVFASFLIPEVTLAFVAAGFDLDLHDSPLAGEFMSLAAYVLAGVCPWYVWLQRVPRALLVDPAVGRRETAVLVGLGVPWVAVSVGLFYLTYTPLWYVMPGYVEAVLGFASDLATERQGLGPGAYVVALVVSVIAAPFVEELIFRGFLLDRWRQRFGTVRAVVFSSLLFGVLHVDFVGAALFGAFMCWIRLRTGTLAGPVLVHFGNNAVAESLSLLNVVWPYELVMTLDTLRAGIPFALAATAIGALWLWWFACTRLLGQRPAVPGSDLGAGGKSLI